MVFFQRTSNPWGMFDAGLLGGEAYELYKRLKKMSARKSLVSQWSIIVNQRLLKKIMVRNLCY